MGMGNGPIGPGGDMGCAAAGPCPGAMPCQAAMQMAAAQSQQMQMAAMMQMQMQMQMAQMAQMAQMQMMSGMMPMMAMQYPIGAMMPVAAAAPVVVAANGADDAPPMGSVSMEELNALEAEVREAEREAKAAARTKDAYVGLMARYIEDEGFGFISCAECKEVWDKTDIFISGRNFMAANIDVGDMVTFQVEKDGKELPRAVNPKLHDELTKMRKKLARMREALRLPPMPAPGKRGAAELDGEPPAKRLHAPIGA